MASLMAISSARIRFASSSRLSSHRLDHLRVGTVTREGSLKHPAHSLDGPKKIDGGGPRAGKRLRNPVKFAAQRGNGPGAGILDPQGDAHRRRHTDGRRPADHHGANGFRHFIIVTIGAVDFLAGSRVWSIMRTPSSVHSMVLNIVYWNGDLRLHDALDRRAFSRPEAQLLAHAPGNQSYQ